ncbi:MAG TPA: aldehyde dehydrogenase family protein, partial [Acidimicrobiales bacterium]|nr:aldehyde dehydrogenase family protein [Acidimicrobiales bacterium]
MAIATINPATAEVEQRFEEISEEELDQRLDAAAAAFDTLRGTTFDQRAAWMRRAAELLDEEQEATARLVTTEMGKTLKSARAEVAKCAKGARYYANHAEALLADEPAEASAVGASAAYGRYQPLGAVLAVMPWNFPLWQAMRFASPGLMAGNVGLLKHASNVPQTALYLGDLFRRAGFPQGAFQTLLIGSSRVEAVIRDRRVAAVTLTGSGPAGAAVGAVAGECIKPSVLELGGSDAFVVMPSADLERAAAVATTARCQNNGQSCIAAKRFIVHEAVAEEFERRFVEKMSGLALGDPTAESTDIGPLATEQGRDDVEELVADAVDKGA